MSKKKVLVIRFSSIGDIVLTSPVPRILKTQRNDIQVHYCTKKQYYGLVADNPYIDKIHLLEGRLSDLVRELKKEKFDYVIDLHHNIRTRIVKLLINAKSHSFNKLNVKKWLLVNLKINQLPNVHIVDRYIQTLEQLGVHNDHLGLEYYIPDKDIVEQNWLPATHQKEYVAFAIGAKFATKKLPFAKLIQLCHQINKPIILLGGKEDFETGEKIEEFFDSEQHKRTSETVIFNGCGKFNLNQSASIVRDAKYVFSHDTGLMHIAAAFKKEIFSIWGNTVPMFGMYPYKTKFTIFENNNISCRPCSKIGFKKCPRGHFKCMNDLKFDFYLP